MYNRHPDPAAYECRQSLWTRTNHCDRRCILIRGVYCCHLFNVFCRHFYILLVTIVPKIIKRIICYNL